MDDSSDELAVLECSALILKYVQGQNLYQWRSYHGSPRNIVNVFILTCCSSNLHAHSSNGTKRALGMKSWRRVLSLAIIILLMMGRLESQNNQPIGIWNAPLECRFYLVLRILDGALRGR